MRKTELKAGDSFEIDYQVTEKIYLGFMDLFNDRSPLHTDDGFAVKKNFREKLMHGAVLAGFISNFIGEWLPENLMSLSYNITFNKPVYMGDNLKFFATAEEISPSVNLVNFKFRFENADKLIVSRGKISLGIV